MMYDNNAYGNPQLNFGLPPIDSGMLNFGMPTQPQQMPMASPTSNGVAPNMGVPSVMAPVTAPMAGQVQPPAGGAAPQSFGNSLIWNGTGEDRSLNYQGLGLISSGIQTLGSLYNTWQQSKLARESLNLQRDAYESNLANQTQTYNNSLEDRIRGRYTVSQQDDPAIQAQIDERKL